MFQCIKFLHQRGADLQVVNNSGESLLHLLICDNYYRRLHGMRAGYYNSVLPQLNRVLEYLLGKYYMEEGYYNLVLLQLNRVSV